MRAVLRRLELAEMGGAARVHRAAFDERLPWLAGLHTPAEDEAYFRDQVFKACEVFGAFAQEELVGIIAFREAWIDQLYVLPKAQGQGIGTSLLSLAQHGNPALSLWTFARNEAARRFYEGHGFVAIERTDGSRNEAREPDILYRWSREVSRIA